MLESGRERAKNTTRMRARGVGKPSRSSVFFCMQRTRPALCVGHGPVYGSHTNTHAKDNSMTLVIYLVGWLILIGGVSWALVAMHVTQHTILIVDVILLGIAVITGATRARNRDRS